jgi:hypothetical protein
MTTLTRDDTLHGVEYVTKHEAEMEASTVPDSYVPFGPEWEKEVMKLPKKFIVEMLRKALMANHLSKSHTSYIVELIARSHLLTTNSQ